MAIPILFLISALCIFSSVSATAILVVSIDCGSSASYTDSNLITWTGDDDYLKNGESHVVQTAYSFPPAMNSLRAFTTRSKNCYAIKATKGERVLLRASFLYGNYDSKSSPPTFDLQFDGNRWASVETSMDGLVSHEVIYVMKGDYVSVCVAQTQPDQFPFMSALELRSLLPTMYDKLDRNYPLHHIDRLSYGAGATIRFADDFYDRMWVPVAFGDELTAVSAEALDVINSDMAVDLPPDAVMKTAMSAVAKTLIHVPLRVPSGEIPIYLNMYFMEVMELDPSTQKRSFQITINDENLLNELVTPSYGIATEVNAIRNLTASSTTTINLVPTEDSTLAPLINAMEVFTIGAFLTDGTHTNDVAGLALLQKAFPDQLKDWRGDPCLPSNYHWDWINCSTDSTTTRVTALSLGSFGLSGGLPDFSGMDALQTIDFQNNNLNGSIPEFLATLPNLKQLNLSSNQFSGSIPNSLSEKNGLNLDVTRNPEMCTGKMCSPQILVPGGTEKSKLGLILGTTIPIFLGIWAISSESRVAGMV